MTKTLKHGNRSGLHLGIKNASWVGFSYVERAGNESDNLMVIDIFHRCSFSNVHRGFILVSGSFIIR